MFLLRQEDVGGVERTRPQTARADLRAAETDRPGVESEGESEGSSDDEDSDESDAEESGRADIVRGRTRTRHNGTRPQRPERKSLDEGMLDFLHKVREKGQRGRYTAVRTLLAPVKPLRGASRAEGEGEGGGHDSQGTRRREKTDMEAEPVEEGITEPAERRGSVRSVGGEDNDSSVDSRIERNLRTAVKRSELLVEGFADVVKQIEAAEIGEEKKEELMEEVLDRMPPEGPFELP